MAGGVVCRENVPGNAPVEVEDRMSSHSSSLCHDRPPSLRLLIAYNNRLLVVLFEFSLHVSFF